MNRGQDLELAIRPLVLVAVLFVTVGLLHAQVPNLLNYQGRVAVGGTNFTGTGQFKFALVDGSGSPTWWSNGSGIVSTPVTNGLYAVLLGDTNLPNMAAIPATVFTNTDVRLRVWFDGGVGLQQMTPDQRLAGIGYAIMAGNVLDGAITGTKLAEGAVGSSHLAANLTVSNLTVAGMLFGNGEGLTNVAGTVVWQNVASTNQQMQPNTGYLANRAAQVIFTLPLSPKVGDIVRVSANACGWRINQNAGQTVLFWNQLYLKNSQPWTVCETNFGYLSSFAISAYGAKLVVVPYPDMFRSLGIVISTNFGATWTACETNRDFGYVAMSADGTKLAASGGLRGSLPQICTSTDSGVTWTATGTNLNWRSVAMSADGTKLAAVGYNTSIYFSNDSGVTWTATGTNLDWACVAMSTDGTKLAAVGDNTSIYFSNDSAVTWTATGTNLYWRSLAMSADGTKLAAVGSEWVDGVPSGHIMVSTDSATTWMMRNLGYPFCSVALSADGSTLVAGGTNLCVSADFGATWVVQEGIHVYGSNLDVSTSAERNRFIVTTLGVSSPFIYTYTGATVVGVNGYVLGSAGSSIELQYFGNGQFLPISGVGSIVGY